ncbi:MAG: SDR family oxidoreductase [Halofilum sp. (in: g-proteobacteria)]|nr:SDR family oxidoreductase [Halofilum sp. (in: g-proteobacteria)]
MRRRQGALEEAAAAIGAEAAGTVTPVVADVTRPDDVRALFAAAVAAHGGVDILVNNAGTAAAARFLEVDDDAWQRDLELKLFGAIRCCREAIPLMQQRGGGSIVNLSTPGGKAPPPGTLPTSVSRAAGISLTKALSQEHAGDNIRVNAVCIGLVKSGQNDRRFEARRHHEPGLTRARFYAEEAAGIPLGRVGESEEAGDVIAFLASARAAYVTGVTINVDGGAAPVV